jgi:hypothetical protein
LYLFGSRCSWAQRRGASLRMVTFDGHVSLMAIHDSTPPGGNAQPFLSDQGLQQRPELAPIGDLSGRLRKDRPACRTPAIFRCPFLNDDETLAFIRDRRLRSSVETRLSAINKEDNASYAAVISAWLYKLKSGSNSHNNRGSLPQVQALRNSPIVHHNGCAGIPGQAPNSHHTTIAMENGSLASYR